MMNRCQFFRAVVALSNSLAVIAHVFIAEAHLAFQGTCLRVAQVSRLSVLAAADSGGLAVAQCSLRLAGAIVVEAH